MAAGLPCVVSDIRGCKDLIENGVNGFLCNPLNPDDFSEKISFLLNNTELKEKFKIENKTRIKLYDYITILKKLENMYFKH